MSYCASILRASSLFPLVQTPALSPQLTQSQSSAPSPQPPALTPQLPQPPALSHQPSVPSSLGPTLFLLSSLHPGHSILPRPLPFMPHLPLLIIIAHLSAFTPRTTPCTLPCTSPMRVLLQSSLPHSPRLQRQSKDLLFETLISSLVGM